MTSYLLALVAAALSFTQAPPETLICTPAGYTQVQGGEVYDRVDCGQSKKSNPQCAAASYTASGLQVSRNTYTSRGELPKQDEFLGTFDLTIDRSTGAYQFIVIARMDKEPSWSNVKTFWGVCGNPSGNYPL